MELTWPIDTYCWVVHDACLECRSDPDNVCKQIYLSTLPTDGYFARISFHGSKLTRVTIIDDGMRGFSGYTTSIDGIITKFELGYFADTHWKLRLIYEILKQRAANYQFNRNTDAYYCNTGQQIVAVIKEVLPMPIADEIVLHLHGSVRMILAEIS